MYKIGQSYSPYTLEKDQDTWVVEIDRVGKDQHNGCIEVRHITKEEVLILVNKIVASLNKEV